ncbi:phage tail protein [Aggregatibacter actinomycetemcomitans]|uniref:phage tail protein n=1 Tax=Aggregatibacter actinomycetemcomitans TaxID=714 RepID=UPI00197C6EAE|nr:phage tail protein [Aggregatibacter actinomycetemcomitans]MBN6060409.1 phage tail protein [Aggregatibacter actinomycetemcomitans]MBN6088961.1 phage tail protein [Aggregatibacter actinomycetemcomitans]
MGGKKGKSVTVGYRYYWDIQSGLGRGPVDEIVELRVDDKTAYVGKPGELTHSQAIYVDKPNLFGGDNTGGEGGIQGRMEILMGEPDQKPTQMLINLLKGVYNPSAANNQTGRGRKRFKKDGQHNKFFRPGNVSPGNVATDETIPGFRGIVTTVFSGLISCYNAYPKKHSYRVRRAHKGWHNGVVWYAEKAKILLRNDNLKIKGLTAEQEQNVRQIHAMNPAHILVECATNKSWGGKKDLSELDLDSYKKAADTLFDEGFGLCIRYNRQTSIKDFIKQIVDHIGAAQYDNVETGKQAIKLIRQDYNVADLPLFSYDNGIVAVLDDDSAATDKQANQVIVKYREPVTNREDQAIANNIAAVQMHGVISKTVEYKGVPTFDLAARLAQRDLEMIASGLTRLKITFDMRDSELRPGDVIRVNLPDRDIVDVVFRVGELKNGNEGEIVATCLQDVYGMPAANYSTQKGESLYVPPDYTAKPIDSARLFEVPYHVLPLVLSDAERAFIKPTDCFVWSLGAQPTALSVGYDLIVDAGAGFEHATEGSFTPSVVLDEDIAPYQTQVRFVTDGDYSGLSGAEALMIDDEIVKIDSVNFTKSILTIGRGCADTIPQSHKRGARAWCYLIAAGTNETKYTVNEKIKAKLLTRTQQETLSEDKAQELVIVTRKRQARPYPPGKVQADGIYSDTIADGSKFKLTWAHRDRDIQADKLIAHTEDSTILGDGVSYQIALLDGSNIVRTITTTDTEFLYPDEAKKEGEQFNRITLSAVKNGLSSLFNYQFNVAGAMQLLYDWDYKAKFTQGDNYLNRYDDGYFGGLPYFMLSSSLSPTSELYRDFAVTPGEFGRFALNYKILSYSQRRGKCKVIVQLLNSDNLVKSIDSGLLGDYPTDDWHPQQVTDILPPQVTSIRFKIVVQDSIANNALAFRDITIRVGK